MSHPETPRISVVLADDHPIFLDGLRHLLVSAPDIDIVGEVGTGAQAVAMITELKPRIAVIDVSMPEMNGLAVLQQLTLAGAKTQVIMLTLSDDPSTVNQAIRYGARGYVLKRSARDNLLFAIRSVSRNGLYIDPLVAGRMMELGSSRHPNKTASPGTIPKDLTPREAEVLKRIAFGYTIKEIASQIGVTVKSVETYKTRASEKFQLGSRAKIVQFGILQGWFDPT